MGSRRGCGGERSEKTAISKLCSSWGASTRAPADNTEITQETWKSGTRIFRETVGNLRQTSAREFSHSWLDQTPANCIAHETCCLVNVQLLHEPHAVRFGRFHADTQ